MSNSKKLCPTCKENPVDAWCTLQTGKLMCEECYTEKYIAPHCEEMYNWQHEEWREGQADE